MPETSTSDEIQHRGILLINNEGHSLHFVISIKNSSEQEKLKKKIKKHLGFVTSELNDVGPYSIVLLDNPSWNHEKVEKFKIGYIYDCLDKGRILDIGEYLWTSRSNLYRPNFDYMDVIYFRKHTWNNIPEKYLFIFGAQSNMCCVYPLFDSKCDSDSSSAEDIPLPSVLPPITPKNKETRPKQPYNKAEKEAIINHIVQQSLYHYVKGVRMWKEMERLKICPNRTWQSMKEHTLKSLAKELNIFKSITPKQKQKLNDVLNPRHK